MDEDVGQWEQRERELSGGERLSISMDLAAGRKITLLSVGSSHCWRRVPAALNLTEKHQRRCVSVCMCAVLLYLLGPV